MGDASFGELWDEREVRILSRFVRNGVLVRIPARRGKRRLVLEWLVQAFEPGLRYEEWQVNLTLKAFHSDPTSLRRHLIEEELMARRAGTYWRIGGRVPEP